MTTLTKSTSIDAPAEAVFEFMKDPAKLMGKGALGTDVHDVTRTPDGVGTTFTWEDKVLGFHVTGVNEYTEVVPNHRLVMTASKGFVFDFRLDPDGEGTKLTLAVQDVAKNWAAAAFDAVAMKLTAHDLDTWLAHVKTAVESAPRG